MTLVLFILGVIWATLAEMARETKRAAKRAEKRAAMSEVDREMADLNPNGISS